MKETNDEYVEVIRCSLCGCSMKKWESNNPQPILVDANDRVCRNCNDYVTATRLVLRGASLETTIAICSVIAEVIRMGSALRENRKAMWSKQQEEE